MPFPYESGCCFAFARSHFALAGMPKRSRRRQFTTPTIITTACLKGGLLAPKTDAPLEIMKFEEHTFVKVSKNSPWLCHAATGHTFTRSQIRESEYFEKLWDAVNKKGRSVRLRRLVSRQTQRSARMTK